MAEEMEVKKEEVKNEEVKKEEVKKLPKKNDMILYCSRCPSKILNPGGAIMVEVPEFKLPKMVQGPNADVQTDEIKKFWEIDDINTFENIGVSKTVDQYKYLACADCELGPIGYFEVSSLKSYVAPNRVKQQPLTEEQLANNKRLLEKTKEEQSENKAQQSQNKEQQLQNKEQQSHNEEQQVQNEEQQVQNEEQQLQNEDLQLKRLLIEHYENSDSTHILSAITEI